MPTSDRPRTSHFFGALHGALFLAVVSALVLFYSPLIGAICRLLHRKGEIWRSEHRFFGRRSVPEVQMRQSNTSLDALPRIELPQFA